MRLRVALLTIQGGLLLGGAYILGFWATVVLSALQVIARRLR